MKISLNRIIRSNFINSIKLQYLNQRQTIQPRQAKYKSSIFDAYNDHNGIRPLTTLPALSSSLNGHVINDNNDRNVTNHMMIIKRNYYHDSNTKDKLSSNKRCLNHMVHRQFFNYSTNNNRRINGRLYRWNDVLFSSTFNEIVRFESMINEDLTQYSLFREKNFTKSFDRGFFSLMPFVVRSLERLIELIDDHMYEVNAQKITMPSIVGKHLWLRSERWELSGQEIFRLKDRHQSEYCLAPTHEEVVTQIIASCSQLTHRQLPIYLYQISPKYRDEIRTKFGLVRAREFIMKDLYTFDKNEDTAKETYDKICSIYEKIFKLLELPVIKTVGSVGTIGGKHSHEFLLETNLGEDEIYTCLNCFESFNAELLDDEQTQAHCLNCKSFNLTKKRRALELGHSFLLSDHYSKRMDAVYLAEHSNKPIPLQMGCYGLGVSRILAASVEYLSNKYQSHSTCSDSEHQQSSSTQSGSSSTSHLNLASSHIFLRWPKLIVPFKICIILPKHDSKEDRGKGTDFSLHLAKLICDHFGEDVLIDDRSNLTIGKRLLTAKTIGIPFILVAGRNIIDQRPKFELFDMYNSDDCYHDNNGQLMTQANILDFLNVNLKNFQFKQ